MTAIVNGIQYVGRGHKLPNDFINNQAGSVKQ